MMYKLIVGLPLLAALIAGLGCRVLSPRAAQLLTSGAVTTGAVLSWVAFFSLPDGATAQVIDLFTWIKSGSFDVSWQIRVDRLTCIMLVVVNTVSALVHIYSIGYMEEDPSKQRFQAYLSLFTFAMLMLVTSDNFLQLYFGWEGVGLASYLLIGFWFHKDTANAASMKAFIVNRVGDFGFGLGIMGIYWVFGTLSFDGVFSQLAEFETHTFTFLSWEVPTLTTLCLLLFMGAMGKSAQFPLHTWLPDAMEGPTPVSALIHAATMVTAGVFLVARCSPMYAMSPDAMFVVACVGGFTAIFAASIGLVQNDIKRVIAYSTCSQLGYMFFALGVGAYGAAIFHLFTHAFFKALLFLGAGSVIHAQHHEQDMRNMGGLRKRIPFTFTMMLIGTVALTGVGIPGTHIGFAGFLSKDTIIESAFAGHLAGLDAGLFVFVMGISAAFFTSFYSWRLAFMTFEGESRADEHTKAHIHESPLVMTIPLLVLAVGAVAAGMFWFGDFVGPNIDAFWGNAIVNGDIVAAAQQVPFAVKASPFVVMLLGLILAWWFYIKNPGAPKHLAETQEVGYQFLLNKWYFDELYALIFIKPSMILGRFLWKKGDGAVVDGLGPDGVAASTLRTGNRIAGLQSGYIFHYAFAMLIGVVLMVTYYLFAGA